MNHLLLPVALVCAVQLAGYEAARIRNRGCMSLGATCASCDEMRICASRYEPPIIEQCPRETPYCKSGSCSTVPDPALCASKFNGFTCPPEDGTYPDGESCKKYHICIGGQATTYNCNLGYADFIVATKSCRKHYNDGIYCWKAECSGSKTYARYGGDHSLYFLCIGGKPTLIHRCPKGANFNEGTGKCDICQKEGRMGDFAGDGTTFMECTQVGSDLQSERRQCPVGSVFDQEKLDCTIDLKQYVETPNETPNR